MKRSIMKVGPSTLVISLPSAWAKKFKLKKGEELFIDEQGASLRVETKKPLKESAGFVDISNDNLVLRMVMDNLYKMGYCKISVKYDPNSKVVHRYKKISQFDLVKNRAEHFTGMDITDIKKTKSGNYIEIEERAELRYSDFKKTMNNAFYYLINQAEQVFLAMKEGRKDIENEVWMTERLLNQSTDFCMRLLNTQGFEDYKKTGIVFYLTNRLEEIGDEYYHMYMNYQNNDFVVLKSQIKMLKETLELIKTLFKIFSKFDIDLLNSFYLNTKQMVEYYEENFVPTMSIKNLRSMTFLYSIHQKMEDLTETLISLNHEKFRVE